MVDAATMSMSDDSDEEIFDATAMPLMPAVGCKSLDTLLQSAEDETSCEMLQFSGSDEMCSVDPSLESGMPAYNQSAIQPTNSDSDCLCNLENDHLQDSAVLTSSGLVECRSFVDVDSSVANMHCGDTGQTTDSIVRTDSTNTSLTDAYAPEVIGFSQTVEPADSRVSVNSNEADDELLAELENEFSCMTPVQNDYMLDHGNANEPLSLPADQSSNDDLTSAFSSLQRRQQALECRLQNTLEAKRQLETENARLECKLSASVEALEAAKQDIESAKSQVGSEIISKIHH